eukprot:2131126-Pyramimonas_sp.AAC.1
MDWAAMLERMYLRQAASRPRVTLRYSAGFSCLRLSVWHPRGAADRWAAKGNRAVREVERSEGDEGLLKSATFEVDGRFAYGMLTAERGTHRL